MLAFSLSTSAAFSASLSLSFATSLASASCTADLLAGFHWLEPVANVAIPVRTAPNASAPAVSKWVVFATWTQALASNRQELQSG